MPKISRYKEEITPKLSDNLIGTDVGSNKTKNFSFGSILNLINSSNNNQYQYFGAISRDDNYFTAGCFFTDTFFNQIGTFNELIINKQSTQELDLTEFIEKISTLENIVLKLQNANVADNFFNFKVILISNHHDYFKIKVSLLNNLFLGELIHLGYYNFNFEIENNIQGKSAYEEWLALGNVGTPQDFIDSLQTTGFDDLRLIVTQDGQTTFNIFNKPKKSNLFLNDSTYFENISYQIREINNSWKLIWLNEVTLTTTDLLIIRKF